MKVKNIIHAVILAIEFECLVGAGGFIVCKSLPSVNVLSDSQVDFEVRFSDHQDKVLEDLDVCWLYYFTKDGKEQDNSRLVKWSRRDFKNRPMLTGRLPGHVTGFKLDFQFRRKRYFENLPPRISDFRIGNMHIPEQRLTQSYWPTGDIPAWKYMHCTPLNGHLLLWGIMMVAGGVLFLCGFLCFMMANKKDW